MVRLVVTIQKSRTVRTGLSVGRLVWARARLCLSMLLGVVSNIWVLCRCTLVVRSSRLVRLVLCGVNISSGHRLLTNVTGLRCILVSSNVLVRTVEALPNPNVVLRVTVKLVLWLTITNCL